MAGDRSVEVHEGHPSERRQVRFDWSDTPAQWIPGDPFSSHVLNVLHLLLPTGERWFAASINLAKEQVKDPELREAIGPFIGQESWHAWAHTKVLEHLEEVGIDTAPYTERMDRAFKRVLGDHPSWPKFLQGWWMRRRLGAISAIEHFTAVLGHFALTSDAYDRYEADPVMADLFRWHAAEEVEHRSLVFDVHVAVGGRWSQRVSTMATTIPVLFGLWIIGANFMFKADPEIRGRIRFNLKEYRRAVREGKLPGLKVLFGTVPRYLRPGYNPVQEFDTQLALDYLARSPAAQAAAEAADSEQVAEGGDVSFEGDIKELFREKDRKEMAWAYDLWSHEDVSKNADVILERVEKGDMPCDGPWSEEQVDLFRRWTETGAPP